MSPGLDASHDAALRSWLDTANASGADFPIQNLPFGAFRRRGNTAVSLGVALGDRVLDLRGLISAGFLEAVPGEVRAALCESDLNRFLTLGRPAWSGARRALSRLFAVGEQARPDAALLPAQSEVEFAVPMRVGDYTDFYASIHHATNVGAMFRPENPLLPNYKYVPIGYHGRASSLVVSGTPVARPSGQLKDDDSPTPTVGPTRALDYECEVGIVIGPGNARGTSIPLASAAEHIFGYCLVNDWSARDIQRWEYQPLGPFLSKSFATTVSPWIVTAEALIPFRAPARARPEGDPAPLPYLADQEDRASGGLDLELSVLLQTRRMRQADVAPERVSRASFLGMYWTPAQLVTHHASNGCNLRPGDLLATGTISGEAEDARGCLLELTRRGARPLLLPGGETRTFLEEGDEVILRGRCERSGRVGIGLGDCRGTVTA